ncbi:hypothetical protein CCUS01_01618 [Colletotrichum cuscutae]|uniref:Uncharacterized protein n=1 Tax=Colletotrichum cuscutae TaxID=1209917 RepID=A0AAI9XRP0_9PEZI|nr:hypothetical protein CCUS01_01618 [Colletotrichum cuscutae]
MDVAPIVPTLPWYLTVPTVPDLGDWGSVPPLLPCPSPAACHAYRVLDLDPSSTALALLCSSPPDQDGPAELSAPVKLRLDAKVDRPTPIQQGYAALPTSNGTLRRHIASVEPNVESFARC